MSESAKAVLQKVFPKMSERALDYMLQTARIAEYPANYVLCRKNEIEDIFYILVDGKAEVYQYREGHRFLVDKLVSGDCFGEIGLILESPRAADVIASEKVTVIEIDRAIFEAYVEMNSSLVVEVTRQILQRMLRQTDRLMVEIAGYRKKAQPAPQFFISYSRADLIFVSQLAADLEKHGINFWMDVYNLDPGASWIRNVQRALDTCSAMLLVITPEALDSEHVGNEWSYYLSKTKPVVPILLKQADLPFNLSNVQYVSFFNVDYEVALTRLVSYLRTIEAGRVDEPHEKPAT
jgi:CRP-like cAMP-binding protein